MEAEHFKKVEFPVYARLALVLIALYLIVDIIILAKDLLVPVAFAALFATLLVPVANFLERIKVNRFLSTLLTVLLAIVIFAILIFFLYRQALLFVADMPLYGVRLVELLSQIQVLINENTTFTVNLELDNIRRSAIKFIQDNVQSLTQILFSIVGGITVFILIPIYIYLFLYYRDFLQEFFIRLFKRNSIRYIRGMTLKIQKVSQRYVGGMFLVSLILSVINTIALFIIGVDHAIFFGFFAGFLNVIPYIGPIVGSVLPILFVLLTKDSIWYAVAVFLYFYIVQLIESYIFIPAIVGKHVNMNPLVVIFALFIGYYTWGVVGMILIIPAIAVLKRIFDEIESLKPFGFLIGGVQGRDEKEEFYKKLKSKISKHHEDEE